MTYVWTALGAVVLMSIASCTGYKIGADNAENEVRLEYLNQKEEFNQLMEAKEKEFNSEVFKLETRIIADKEEYQANLRRIESSYSERMSESERRIDYYKSLSEQSTCIDLSAHTAKLDRALTEGQLLVEELLRHIELRDSQLRQLGKYLTLENQLHE